MTPIDFAKKQLESISSDVDEMITKIPNEKVILILPSVTDKIKFCKRASEIRPQLDVESIKFHYSTDGKQLYPAIEKPGELPVYLDGRVLRMSLLHIVHYHNKQFNPSF